VVGIAGEAGAEAEASAVVEVVDLEGLVGVAASVEVVEAPVGDDQGVRALENVGSRALTP